MGVINNVKALISTSKLTNLANAIRNKTGEVKSYTIDEMIEKINGMDSSVLTSLDVTANGIYTPENGVDGFSQVDVDVNPDLRPLTIDTLTQHGTFLPTSDGFSQVTAEEDWDEILYPVTDETDQFYDLKVFNSKHISIKAGDRLIVDGLGRGVWSAFTGGTSGANRGDIRSRIEISLLNNNVFTHARYELVFPADVTYVLAGYEWSGTGTHSTNGNYCFYGEYLKYKIIRAS